jgi:hypothetical protein
MPRRHQQLRRRDIRLRSRALKPIDVCCGDRQQTLAEVQARAARGLSRGSYILTFAGDNAGRGSVKKWIERYGNPHDPKVDAVDWVGSNKSVLRNAQLRAADHGEPAGLSRAVRRRDQAPDRSRPASRRQRPIAEYTTSAAAHDARSPYTSPTDPAVRTPAIAPRGRAMTGRKWQIRQTAA